MLRRASKFARERRRETGGARYLGTPPEQQKVKIRRAWSRRMAASFSPGFACSKSRKWVSRRSLEVPAWPDAFFLAIPAQSVRHQSAARDHREAVRFRADSKGKSVDGEAHRDGGYTGNPPPYPLVHECRSR